VVFIQAHIEPPGAYKASAFFAKLDLTTSSDQESSERTLDPITGWVAVAKAKARSVIRTFKTRKQNLATRDEFCNLQTICETPKSARTRFLITSRQAQKYGLKNVRPAISGRSWPVIILPGLCN
jgi:hypothetical protein